MVREQRPQTSRAARLLPSCPAVCPVDDAKEVVLLPAAAAASVDLPLLLLAGAVLSGTCAALLDSGRRKPAREDVDRLLKGGSKVALLVECRESIFSNAARLPSPPSPAAPAPASPETPNDADAPLPLPSSQRTAAGGGGACARELSTEPHPHPRNPHSWAYIVRSSGVSAPPLSRNRR